MKRSYAPAEDLFCRLDRLIAQTGIILMVIILLIPVSLTSCDKLEPGENATGAQTSEAGASSSGTAGPGTTASRTFTIPDISVDVGQTVPLEILSDGGDLPVGDLTFEYSGESFAILDGKITGLKRGPGVKVTATDNETGRKAEFYVTVRSELRFFLDNLGALFDAAYIYDGDRALELTFNFIRGQKYNDKTWQGVAGKWDASFRDHIKESFPGLYGYFICDTDDLGDDSHIITLSDPGGEGYIDMIHFSAVMNRLCYTGKTTFGDIPTFGILDRYVDDLCGWAGDLQTLICDYFRSGNASASYDEVYGAFYAMIGNAGYSFGLPDLSADIDACNIRAILGDRKIDSGERLISVISDYYTGGGETVCSKRFTAFVGGVSEKELKNRIAVYCTDRSPLSISWPLLSEYPVTDEHKNAFSQAFADYLISAINAER